MQRILFVCLGNICRSPTAEAVLRHKAAARGIEIEIDSAGTAGWHEGKPPYAPMQSAARNRGYDLSPLRARQVTRQDLDRFDLVLAMDDQNLEDLRALGRGQARVERFVSYAGAAAPDHVPDPYYTRDFDGALGLIEDAAEGLLDALSR